MRRKNNVKRKSISRKSLQLQRPKKKSFKRNEKKLKR